MAKAKAKANIDPYVLGPNLYDLDGLTHDVLTKMVNDHAGQENGCTHRELCQYYFSPHRVDEEAKILISVILQRARGVLQQGGWFLDYREGHWFVAQTPAEAFEHIRRYTKREVKLHGRLQTKVFIAIGDTYQLPANNQLIQAIRGMTPAVEQLEQAIEEAELPAPSEEDEE
jgi:hypothetical protein